jgi:hypothetical protein
LMRAQMFFMKQPAPPPWTTPLPYYPPTPQTEHPINNPQMESQNMMHQIPQHQLPLYRDMLLRQQSSS